MTKILSQLEDRLYELYSRIPNDEGLRKLVSDIVELELLLELESNQ